MGSLYLRGTLLICCSLLGWGCTRWTYDIGRDLSLQEIPAVEDGLQVGDVLARLGPPLRISKLPGGYVLAYEHWHIMEDSVGLSLSQVGADFISLDWGGSRTQGEFVLLSFNSEHKLVDSSYEKWHRDAGGGQGIQPLVSVISVVEVDDLTHHMPQHRWGAFSLQKLPVALNIDSSPDMGQHGLEQRGTPLHIGQRSLEIQDRR